MRRPVWLLVLALALVLSALSGIGVADEGGGGNNLAVPVIFAEGYGLSGFAVDADDYTTTGFPGLGKCEGVEAWGGTDVLEVDAFIHYRRAVGRDAVSDQHRLNARGGADETFDLAVLPAGEGVGTDVKVHPPRGHESRRSRPPCHRACQRREGDPVRVVGMNHRRLQLPDQP